MRLRGHCRPRQGKPQWAQLQLIVITAPLLVQKKRGLLPPHGPSATPAPCPLPHTPRKAWQRQAAPLAVCTAVTCGRPVEQNREVLQGQERGLGGGRGRGQDGWVQRLNQGRGGSVPSSLISRLTILLPIRSSSPSPPRPPSLLSLLWPVHLQPLSLGNKAEGFVYWRLEEKWGHH